MQNFRTFDLAVEFYRLARCLMLPRHAKDQLTRAAHSIALNLAEGNGKHTTKEQRRFFHIAMGSLRECQAVLIIEELQNSAEWKVLDNLGAHLYKLIQNAR
ncbi:MAG: four helix bundle protein [Bdellovibrionales bacterium]|nr:four helix bundle protein [Bdellovibrionales bacterium]